MNSQERSRSLPMLVAALAASTALLVSALVMASPANADDTWTQQGIDIDGEAAGDGSGYSVATSADGSTVAIGAPYNRGSAGQVRVYTWDGSTWTQRGGDIDGEAAGDLSGSSVALSADGTTVAIGAGNNDANGTNAGQARVYSWNGSTWTQQGIDIDGEAAGDLLGYSVAMSGDGSTVAIGAPFNDGTGGNAGQVRVYTWNSTNWIQRGGDIDGEAANDFSGWSVALSEDGSTVAVGARSNDGTGSDAGQVRVYTWNSTAWAQRGGDIDGEAAGDESGISVALSADGTTVAIGARYNSGNVSYSGQVRVYTWNSPTWIQRGGDIDGEAANDESGSSVAMSADGTTVAIGSRYNASSGSNAGQVRVYTLGGSTWSQRGGDIDGEAAGDESGKSVAMSADGTTVAIGAPNNDSNGASAGQVRVFTWPVATGDAIPGPATYFTFLLPDGRECTAISPQRVQVGTMVELPGVDALCHTMDGSTVAGWTIPVPNGFTGYGSTVVPFPPGLKVRVIESQRFTLVPLEPILQIDYDANIAARDTCTSADFAHTSNDGRIAHVWVPREIHAMARTPLQAPCVPEGHQLTGWNSAGDGTGTTLGLGAPLPQGWATGSGNHHQLYAVWRISP
jgi:hypothetical protein